MVTFLHDGFDVKIEQFEDYYRITVTDGVNTESCCLDDNESQHMLEVIEHLSVSVSPI